jgi:hypothetical protein
MEKQTQTSFTAPPLLQNQAIKVKQQRRLAKFWRNSFYVYTAAFFIGPAFLPASFRSEVWMVSIACGVVAGRYFYLRWVREHRTFKLTLWSELMGRIFERKLPGYVYAPFRQFSGDWLRVSHLFDSEQKFDRVEDENLISKITPEGNFEIFYTDMTKYLGRAVFAAFAGNVKIRQRDMLITYGTREHHDLMFDVPPNARVFTFKDKIYGVDKKDGDYKFLQEVDMLRSQIAKAIDIKLLRIVVESRQMLVTVWTKELFFDVPTDVKVDAEAVYLYWRRHVRVYTLIARFLEQQSKLLI